MSQEVMPDLAFDNRAGYFRLYNQSAIEAQVASWPIDTAQTPNPPQSEDFQVVRLKLDTYPATFFKKGVGESGIKVIN